jgi:membrane fusion protein, hemolysin D
MKFAEGTITLFRSPKSGCRYELAFLPAALEIVETPVPPLAGAIGGTIIALFCLAIVWAWFGHIDIIASASGKIIPSGRTKVIQPFETGVVRAIRVRDGQHVKAGDVLIELDPTMNEAERNHLQSDHMSAELDIARLTAALSEDADPVASFRPPEGASAALAATQRRFLAQQIEEHRAKLAALDGQKVQKQAELHTIVATVQKLESVLPVLQQRVEIREVLYNHSTGSKANYLELYQTLVETQQELAVQRSRSREAEAALTAITEARAQTAAEFSRTLSGDLVEAQRKAAGLSEDLIKATQRTQLQVLTAPVDGTVQQLAVHTVGGVVTPAQSLLAVVPDDSNLEIEALVSNRDIGFIHVGQEAEIKVDTFNFTRYGLIHGRALSVSRDAITRDKPQDRSNDAAPAATTSEPKGQELVYAARVSLDKTQMQIDENQVDLSPGMAVTVEIKTGSRSVLSYLLSPLLRYRQESLRER